MTKILERAGHSVEVADDGDVALDLLEKNQYSLAILDMQMPTLGGLDTIKAYRAMHLHSPSIPFVILTANITPEAKREAEEAAVDAFLTKPVDAFAVLDVVTQLAIPISHPRKPIAAPFFTESATSNAQAKTLKPDSLGTDSLNPASLNPDCSLEQNRVIPAQAGIQSGNAPRSGQNGSASLREGFFNQLDSRLRGNDGANEQSGLNPNALNHATLDRLEILGAGNDFVGMLIREYIASGEATLASMQALLGSDQHMAFREHMHTLKDLAGNVGADHLAQTCQDALSLSPTELQMDAQVYVRQMAASFHANRVALTQYLVSPERAESLKKN